MSALELAEVLQLQCRELEKRLIECHHKNTELKKDVQRINEVNEKLRADVNVELLKKLAKAEETLAYVHNYLHTVACDKGDHVFACTEATRYFEGKG